MLLQAEMPTAEVRAAAQSPFDGKEGELTCAGVGSPLSTEVPAWAVLRTSLLSVALSATRAAQA